MKPTLLQISKKPIFPQKVQYPLYDIYMTLTLILSVDEDVIQIHNDKNIDLFYQDLADIALEAGRSIG